uniref:Uncharacterized protein n=1 Tax=Oryza sativa subsp. japonica TaxID=39947 RepID=Q67UI8_ORYSJ|nr:hypothetical protein [Oryza sativa Japonica Group]
MGGGRRGVRGRAVDDGTRKRARLGGRGERDEDGRGKCGGGEHQALRRLAVAVEVETPGRLVVAAEVGVGISICSPRGGDGVVGKSEQAAGEKPPSLVKPKRSSAPPPPPPLTPFGLLRLSLGRGYGSQRPVPCAPTAHTARPAAAPNDAREREEEEKRKRKR